MFPLYGAQINVIFTIQDNKTIKEEIPLGVFRVLDQKAKEHNGLQPRTKSCLMLSAKAFQTSAKPINITLSKFTNYEMYQQFKSMWDEPHMAAKKGFFAMRAFRSITNRFSKTSKDEYDARNEQNDNISSITEEKFIIFLEAADALGIQGTALKIFGDRMARKGLLGAYSRDISNIEVLFLRSKHEIIWYMLQSFLKMLSLTAELKYNAKTNTSTLFVEKDTLCIDYEYREPMSSKIEVAMLKDLYLLCPDGTDDRNEIMLGWLLFNVGCLAVEFEDYINVGLDSISTLKRIFQIFSNNSGSIKKMSIKKLLISISPEDIQYAPVCLPRTCFGLRHLGINLDGVFDYNQEKNVIIGLPNCKLLNSIEIMCDTPLSCAFFDNLLKRLPYMTALDVICSKLPHTFIVVVNSHPCLKKLTLRGSYHQPSWFTQKLVTCIPKIQELKIKCMELEDSVAESFQTCKNLEKLVIFGDWHQKSSFVKKLLLCLPNNLKELEITCQELEGSVVERFKHFKCLERLVLNGAHQRSSFIETLVQYVPKIRELEIKYQTLTWRIACAFQTSWFLEELSLFSETHGAIFVSKMLNNLICIKKLRIDAYNLDRTLALKLSKLYDLESLEIHGHLEEGFMASFLQMSCSTTFKRLVVVANQANPTYSEEDIKEIESNRKQGVYISIQNKNF
ncbi:hypothetical protein NECID01_0247 [Nematocida sp. AWRm77]|nr:hypothetical protein NECID01_0247 [Nematocida sp. AWRm77]